jgi:hypothetical protein
MVLHRPVELAVFTGHLDFLCETRMGLDLVAERLDYTSAS